MKLLEIIEQAFQHVNQPSASELKSIIDQLGLTPDHVSPCIQEPSLLPYGRTVLYESPDVEVILIHLPPGTSTYIHDHGASIGCAYVLEGELTNKMYRLSREGYAHEYAAGTVRAGRYLFAPKGQIHQMCNESSERLISFHVYAPRLSGTQRYHTYEQVLDYVI